MARTRRIAVSPPTYRRLAAIALALVTIIIVTGASVRLSGSGLGCDDWPNCTSDELISVDNPNQAIEQINRLFTGLVSLGVIAAVLGAIFRVPRRRDLVRLAWGLVAGVFLQAIIGGITVLVELKWQSVALHFLASIVLVSVGMVLYHRAGEADAGPYTPLSSARVRTLARVIYGWTCWVLFAGTLVTAAGPHGGDEKAGRLDWPIPTAARLHGLSVVILLVMVVALVGIMRRDGAPRRALTTIEVFLAVGAVQAALGYVQYFNGIPALLVGFHVAGAVIVFGAAQQLLLELRAPSSTLEPVRVATAGPDRDGANPEVSVSPLS